MNTTSINVNREKILSQNNLSLKYRKENYRNKPSFKSGIQPTVIAAADRDIMDIFAQNYGEIGDRLGKKVGKLVTDSDLLKRNARITIEGGISQIKDKSSVRSVIENAIFPFVNLPLYGASWLANKAQKIPFLKEGATSVYKSQLLRIPRKINELDAETDILKGMYQKTSQIIKQFAKAKGIELKDKQAISDFARRLLSGSPEDKELIKEANEFIKENLYKASNKFFDKHTGNFNTAFERPLNRIVTGLIPVAFLANDAYNLAVLCGDSKEDSTKEAKERRKQEITRVMMTAYIQLITFGAFTKQVNTIPWFTPLTSAATVLFSEVISRKRLGKPVLFLSKDKAKEMNIKNKGKDPQIKTESSKETEQNQKNNVTPDTTYTAAHIKEPSIFESFKASIDNSQPQSPETDKSSKSETDNNKDKERKALINFSTFKKAVAISIAAGFALSFLKNSSFTKNSKIVQAVKDFGKLCKQKLYDPLAYKDFEITQAEFDRITSSLKEAGCEGVAQGHEFIKDKYSKTAHGIIKMIKGNLSSENAKKAIQTISESLRNSNVPEEEIVKIEQSIKTAIGKEGVSIAERKYVNVAKKAIEIISNKKINLDSGTVEKLEETITHAIEANAKESAIRIETKMKPFVDIVTQPFKFILSAVKLPYKITTTMINLLVSPIEKKAAEAALGKAELTKFEKTIHKVVTEVFGEKSSKVKNISQEIFANAMEQLQKRTLPYTQAKSALERVRQTGNPVEIKKAEEYLKKVTKDLMLYVNRAVEKSFNGVTLSSNKNTDLAMMSKLASSAVTSAFLVADNYNMVMLKSNGEDKEGAKEKANERIIQRLSALFYQSLLINWFNSTFMSTYNSSLNGMMAVAAPNTITTEILTRKSIGMPIGRKTLEQLNEIDEKNENRKGFAGKYFKFMRLLTGKKPLKNRLPKDKTQQTEVKPQNSSSISTNYLEIFANK